MKIYNPTGFSSSLTGSFSGSVKGTFEGSFTGESLNNISGAFDSVSASLASDRLKNTTDTLDGDLTVTGTITAQEFHTEFVSASIIYQSGSTKFGDSSDDNHTFVGNLQVGTTALSGSGDPRVTVGSKGNYDHNSGNGLGDFHIGDGNYGLSIGTALGGAGAGDTRIWTTGGTHRLVFLTDDTDFRLSINSVGNIGIGLYDASYKLDVVGFSRFNNGFYLQETTSGTNAAIYLDDSQRLRVQSFGVSGAVRFDVGSSLTEAVIIGSDAQTTFYNNIRFGTGDGVDWKIVGNANGPLIKLRRNSATSDRYGVLGWRDNGAGEYDAIKWQDQTVTMPGSLGIGVTSPGAKLDVDGNIIAGGGNSIISGTGLFTTSTIQLHNGDAAANNIDRMADIVLANNTSYTDGILGRIIAVNSSLGTSEKRNAQISFNNDGATNSGNISFSTSNAGTYSAKMYIKANGNVGIGDSTPNAILHVSAPYPTYTDFGTVFYGGTTNNSSQNGIMLSSAGNALGGVLGSNLFIDGTTWSQTNTGRSTGWLQMTNTTVSGQTSTLLYRGYVKGSNTTVERFSINGDGNVGIGTTSASVPLQIGTSVIGASGGTPSILASNGVSVPAGSRIALDTGYYTHGYLQYSGWSSEAQMGMYGYYGITLATRSGTGLVVRGDTNRVGVKTTAPAADLDVNGSVRHRGAIFSEHTISLNGNYTAGTYYDLFTVALGIPEGIYIIHAYLDTYAVGGGVYAMHFTSVPFYWVNTGSNNNSFCDFPPLVGTGHALNGPQSTLPKFRLQQAFAGAGTIMQFDPGRTWSGIDGSAGKNVIFYFKKLGQ